MILVGAWFNTVGGGNGMAGEETWTTLQTGSVRLLIYEIITLNLTSNYHSKFDNTIINLSFTISLPNTTLA